MKEKMLTIKFNYQYKKMPVGCWLSTMHTWIKAVMVIDASTLTEKQMHEDTVGVDGGVHYTLPKTGKLIRIDLWTDCYPAPTSWATYRTYTDEDIELYYQSLGQEVRIVLT